jgi:hypothetical protein
MPHEVGANADGEVLEAGRVPDCYLGCASTYPMTALASAQPGRLRQLPSSSANS